MVGMLDQLMLGYRAPGNGWNMGAFPAIPGAEPTPEEIIAALRPALIGSQPQMGITGGMAAPGPVGSLTGAQPFERGAMPMAAPGIGMMSQLMPRQAPVSGDPAVTSLDGGPIPLPRPRPREEEVGSRGIATQEPGAPLSLAPPMPPAATSSAAPGMGGGGFRMPSSAFLLALGGGLAGAPSFGQAMRRGFTQAAGVAAQDDLRRDQLALQGQSQADIYRALKSKGVPDVEIMAGLRSPTVLKELSDKYLGGQTKNPVVQEFKTEGGNVVKRQWNAQTGQWDPIPGFEKPAPAERQSVPSGYEWVDPNDPSKGQRAIKGGPAEKITPEVSARIGMAESFLDQLPSIRKDLKAGGGTGPWDALMAKVGQGRAGELRRQIDSGAESLLRNLTGAGMGISEAADYASRYKLQPWDTVDSISSKMNQLERELRYVLATVQRGRNTGAPTVVNGKLVIGDTEAPSSTAPTQRRTRGGITYEIEAD